VTKVEEIEVINKRLQEYFGRDLAGRPNFRLTWSEHETEVRIGNFEDWTSSGNIFLRSFFGAREVRKYQYVQPRWVLERLFWNVCNPELLAKFTYEPLWTFQDKDGDYLFPVWPAVELVVCTVLYGPKKAADDRTVTGSPEHTKRMAEVYYDLISDNSPYLASMLHRGEAASVQGRKDERKPTNG
tara:strand:+ start:8564 stop:9118 length:555 start_codon:yes stop_codon:yes gene_type:complete